MGTLSPVLSVLQLTLRSVPPDVSIGPSDCDCVWVYDLDSAVIRDGDPIVHGFSRILQIIPTEAFLCSSEEYFLEDTSGEGLQENVTRLNPTPDWGTPLMHFMASCLEPRTDPYAVPLSIDGWLSFKRLKCDLTYSQVPPTLTRWVDGLANAVTEQSRP